MKWRLSTMDGNQAAAHVAYRTSEVIAIYPITPASAMGELSDLWRAQNKPNIWGTVPRVIEMQSEGGASVIVLFNRFYQPDIDIQSLEVQPKLNLSTSHALRLPLRWIAMLYGRVPADLALTSGVHTYQDALIGLMAGSSVVMMASELLKNGLGRIQEINEHMKEWMDENEYESVEQLQGSMSQIHVANPTAFERANYMHVLRSWREDPNGVAL